MQTQDFTLRSLTTPDELLTVIELQRLIYPEDAPNVFHHYTLVELARNGSPLLGAFNEHDQLIGYLVSFLGLHHSEPSRPAMANLKLVFERVAVHPDYRGIGIAYQLSLRLRDVMNKQGIRLATHPFHPLDSRAAYIAVGKLGGIAKEYVTDYYGVYTEGASTTASSDRIIAEWWVSQNRVDERINGSRLRLGLKQYLDAETPLLNPTHVTDGLVYPYEASIAVPSKRQMLLLEIPHDFETIVRTDAELALQWKQHVRDGLSTITGAGYVVTDFLYEEFEGRERAFYLLSFDGPQFTVQM